MKKLFSLLASMMFALLFFSCAATMQEDDSDRPEWLKGPDLWTVDLWPEGLVIFATGESNKRNASQARSIAEERALWKIARQFNLIFKENVDANWVSKEETCARGIRFWYDDENTTFVLSAYFIPAKEQ